MTDYETNTRKNDKGLPLQLKNGIESMSGFSMDDVIVHYNSSKPAQMKALAYTQGTDIHVAPGQEKHLGHEAWHVVQQKQGRVAPTAQLKGVNVNTDDALEHEADVMGARASIFSMPSSPVVQRKKTNVQQDAPMQFGRKKKGKGTPSVPAQLGGGSAGSTTTNPTFGTSAAAKAPGVTIERRKKPPITQGTGGSAGSTTTNPTFGTSAAAKAPGVTIERRKKPTTTQETGGSADSTTTNPTFGTSAAAKAPGVTIVRRNKPTTTQETGGSAVSTTTNPTFGTSAAAKAPGVTIERPKKPTTPETGGDPKDKPAPSPKTLIISKRKIKGHWENNTIVDENGISGCHIKKKFEEKYNNVWQDFIPKSDKYTPNTDPNFTFNGPKVYLYEYYLPYRVSTNKPFKKTVFERKYTDEMFTLAKQAIEKIGDRYEQNKEFFSQDENGNSWKIAFGSEAGCYHVRTAYPMGYKTK